MSQELIDALKRTKREQVNLSLGQVPLSPTIARAGRYNVVVAPTPGSNAYTQLASALSRVSPLLSEFGKYQQARGQEDANQLTLEEVIKRVEAGDTDATGILEELGKQRAFSQNIYRRYNADKIVPAFRAVKTELQDLTPEQLIARGIKSPDDFERYAREQFAGVAEGFKEFTSKDRFMAQLHNDYLEARIPVEASNLAQGFRKGVKAFNKEVGEQQSKGVFYSFSEEGTNGSYSGDFVEWMKEREGFEPFSRWDNEQYSVGYGTRATGSGLSITKKQADAALREELTEHYGHVTDIMEEFDGELALNNNQIQALTSLSFNAGPDDVRNLLTGSKVKGEKPLRDLETIKKKWLLYTKGGPGLKNRRIKELELFNTPIPEDRQEQEGEGAIGGRVSVVKQAQNMIHNLTQSFRENPDINRFDARQNIEDNLLAGALHLAKIGREEEAQELLDYADRKGFKFSYAENSPNLFTGSEGEMKLENANARFDNIVSANEDDNAEKAEKRREEYNANLRADMRARLNAGENPIEVGAEYKNKVTNKLNAARAIRNTFDDSQDFNESMNTIEDVLGGASKAVNNHITYSNAQRQLDHNAFGRTAATLAQGNEALDWKGMVERIHGQPADIRNEVFQDKGVDPLDLDSYLGSQDQEVRARAVQLWQGIRRGKYAELERDFHAQAQAKLAEFAEQELTGAALEDEKAAWESGLIQQYEREIFEDFIEQLSSDDILATVKAEKAIVDKARETMEAHAEDELSPVTATGMNLPNKETPFLTSLGTVRNATTYERGTPRFDEAFSDKSTNQIKEFYTKHRSNLYKGFNEDLIELPRGIPAEDLAGVSPFFAFLPKTLDKVFSLKHKRGDLVVSEFRGKGPGNKLIGKEAASDFIETVRSVGLTVEQAKTNLYRAPSAKGKYAPINLQEYFKLDEKSTSKTLLYNIESLYNDKVMREIAGANNLDYAEFRKNQRAIGIKRGLLESSDK